MPEYKDLLIPLLEILKNREQGAYKVIIEKLANQLNLIDEIKYKLNAKGDKYIFNNRLSWAATVLEETGLLTRPSKGYLKITKMGLKHLELDLSVEKILESRPPYHDDAFYKQNESTNLNPEVIHLGRLAKPEKIIENTYQQTNARLAQDLLKAIKSNTPQFFERLVVNLLVKMGYGETYAKVAKSVHTRGDGGIDGVIKQDILGLSSVYVQAKRWERKVGVPEIRAFSGALQAQVGEKGVFITTSDYTKEALEFPKKIKSKIILINGTQLAELMIENNIGVSVVSIYEIKEIDTDYFNYG